MLPLITAAGIAAGFDKATIVFAVAAAATAVVCLVAAAALPCPSGEFQVQVDC